MHASLYGRQVRRPGAGRHQFFIEETFSTCPPGYICFPGVGNDFKETRRENLATGYHTMWLAGAEVGFPRAKGALVFEATRETDARRDDFDFRGWRYAAGFVIRGF